MKRWLLAAEADKIQDFVFRSSRLTEVAGGSALLARFCREAPERLMRQRFGNGGFDPEQIVMAAGGAFRLTFASIEAASAIAVDLEELYHRVTDGALTMAPPLEYDTDAADGDQSFGAVSRRAEYELRLRKADRRSVAVSVPHIPYFAFCASCGIGLADRLHWRHGDERPKYHCPACVDRDAERDRLMSDVETGAFFGRFVGMLRDAGVDLADRPLRDLLPRDADDVGRLDPRRYVAYLVADGNLSGVMFSACRKPDQMHQLSEALEACMWQALANATARVIPTPSRSANDDAEPARHDRLPVMPLIVGGDDLYALLPAPHALDFARSVCRAYEVGLETRAKELGLAGGATPTMSAAVVVCKASYPYALAHRRGEKLLDAAKALGRVARVQDGIIHSAVNFEVVLGSDIDVSDDDADRRQRRLMRTARPYWVLRQGESIDTREEEHAFDISRLLDARWDLRGVPPKRRAELRNVVDDVPDEIDDTAREVTGWQRRFTALVQRADRRSERDARKRGVDARPRGLTDVFAGFGSRASPEAVALASGEAPLPPWRPFPRRRHDPARPGDERFWTALPDLLGVWNFALDAARDRADYEEPDR